MPLARAARRRKKFRLGLITPNGHSWNQAALKFGETLKAETNGRLTLTVFHCRPARQRERDDAADAVRRARHGLHPGRRTRLARAAHRGDQRALPRALDARRSRSSCATRRRVKLLDVLPQETGTIGLGWGITGMRAVFSTQATSTASADIKGMKLRINPTPVYRDFYSALGAAPTPIPTPQVFDAMSNGQVDGLEADLEFSWNQRFDKVSKSILQMNAVFMPWRPLVSGRVWQTLPAADKELITKLGQVVARRADRRDSPATSRS